MGFRCFETEISFKKRRDFRYASYRFANVIYEICKKITKNNDKSGVFPLFLCLERFYKQMFVYI